MHERRREFAVLRCMGASRSVVTGSILWQSIILSFFGALGSLVFYLLLSLTVSSIIHLQIGVGMDLPLFDLAVLYTFLGIVLLGLVSAWLPARQLYKTSLQDSLHPS